MFTSFKIAIIPSIMGKDKFRKCLHWIFHKADRSGKYFHHGPQGKPAHLLLRCLNMSCSNPAFLLHQPCACASECGRRKKPSHAVWSHVHSWPLPQWGPLMLCNSHSVFPESAPVPILLGDRFVLGPAASTTVSPSLYLSGWPPICFHWAMRGDQKRVYKTPLLPLFIFFHFSNVPASPPATMNELNMCFLKTSSFLALVLSSLTSSRILLEQFPATPITFISCITIIFFFTGLFSLGYRCVLLLSINVCVHTHACTYTLKASLDLLHPLPTAPFLTFLFKQNSLSPLITKEYFEM